MNRREYREKQRVLEYYKELYHRLNKNDKYQLQKYIDNLEEELKEYEEKHIK